MSASRRISWPVSKSQRATRPSPCRPERSTATDSAAGGGGNHCTGSAASAPSAQSASPAIWSSSSRSPSSCPRSLRHWLPMLTTSGLSGPCATTERSRTQTPAGGPGRPKLSKMGDWTRERSSWCSQDEGVPEWRPLPCAFHATNSDRSSRPPREKKQTRRLPSFSSLEVRWKQTRIVASMVPSPVLTGASKLSLWRSKLPPKLRPSSSLPLSLRAAPALIMVMESVSPVPQRQVPWMCDVSAWRNLRSSACRAGME